MNAILHQHWHCFQRRKLLTNTTKTNLQTKTIEITRFQISQLSHVHVCPYIFLQSTLPGKCIQISETRPNLSDSIWTQTMKCSNCFRIAVYKSKWFQNLQIILQSPHYPSICQLKASLIPIHCCWISLNIDLVKNTWSLLNPHEQCVTQRCVTNCW